MQTYDCKVRLGDSVSNEVRKTDVTAAEVMVLRAIHGEGAVSDIVKKKMDKRSHAEERKRLYAIYANPEDNNAETVAKKVAMIRNLFGHDALDLPVKLPEEPEVKRTVVKSDEKPDNLME